MGCRARAASTRAVQGKLARCSGGVHQASISAAAEATARAPPAVARWWPSSAVRRAHERGAHWAHAACGGAAMAAAGWEAMAGAAEVHKSWAAAPESARLVGIGERLASVPAPSAALRGQPALARAA